MFSKILIANRGEIACRIIRTARHMGVKTVAVHSDADERALHAELADEAVRIGPAPVSESYLVKEAIIAAALETGAQAIHPGYGFLSENPEFVEAVEAAGLVFIGPSASAIRAMGLKDAAKALMEKAGVPVVPGYHGESQEMLVLAGKAEAIGYPVLIKASAGGGGKGMRRVDHPREFREALASARREAKSAFGDERVLVEKYIENPRHIEVQVFGDNHGNVVHLFERDCSLQRRHQKVIEEAPAPGMTQEMREAMTRAAVRAAKAIAYSGAGTIEFIVDGSNGLRPDGFWFMEMNTRLQVEHPVTERVTGIDLVEWQLRVASGEPLPLAQEEIRLCGHAVESRLYAEDVPKGFLPATGRLEHLAFPPDARIDSGVRTGDVITPHYDPMIAKIITSGPDRAAAIAAQHFALQQTRIAGTVTNRAFLQNLSNHPGFLSGEVDTGLIARDIDTLSMEPEPGTQDIAIAGFVSIFGEQETIASEPFSALGAFSLWGTRDQFADLHFAGERHAIRVSAHGSGRHECEWNGGRSEILLHGRPEEMLRSNSCSMIVDGVQQNIAFARWPGHLALFSSAGTFTFALPDLLESSGEGGAGSNRILAPMPGLVKKVAIAAGTRVEKGAVLVILEAMKMEHSLTAPREGIVAEVNVAEGDQVTDGALLVALAGEAGDE